MANLYLNKGPISGIYNKLLQLQNHNRQYMSFKNVWKDINHSRILYDPPPRILEIKAKINKWDLMKLKSFCTTKETISEVKRQPSDWEKIISTEATDKTNWVMWHVKTSLQSFEDLY